MSYLTPRPVRRPVLTYENRQNNNNTIAASAEYVDFDTSSIANEVVVETSDSFDNDSFRVVHETEVVTSNEQPVSTSSNHPEEAVVKKEETAAPPPRPLSSQSRPAVYIRPKPPTPQPSATTVTSCMFFRFPLCCPS